MASTLASQLQELARQRPVLPPTLKKGKPSLLYDFQTAADVDLSSIYDIATHGLEELIRLEPRFRPYRESLFSRASLDINPDLQTPDFLSKLDESIHGFCCLLCNHYLAAPAFKVLEYLIRRYKANERNVDALLTAALPYHATNEFVRLVQTLALGPPGSLWGWLAKMQSSGASLPRELLAQRCANDRSLLLFVCKAAGQLGSIPSGAAAALRPPSRTFLSFYAVLLCEVLAALQSVSEDFLAALLPHLLEGLGRRAAQDYRAASLMVVAELCSRASLGKDCIKVLLNSTLKHTEPVPEHIRTALLLMAHVAVTQPQLRTLSDKTVKYLSALPNAMSELSGLAQRGGMRLGPLLQLLVRSLAAGVAGGGSGAGRAEGDLLALAHAGVLEGQPAGALAAALLEAGCAAAAGSPARGSCQKVLRVLDQRYPKSTDAAVNAFLEPLRSTPHAADGAARGADGEDDGGKRKRHKAQHGAAAAGAGSDSDDDADADAAAVSAEEAAAGLTEAQRKRFDFVREAFAQGGCYSAPCGGTMLTLAAALAAPQAAVRRMALQQLDADLSSSAAASTPPILTAALACLVDDDLGVVLAALGCSCLRALPPTALLDALCPALHRLSSFLYASSKLPGLKAAKKAARKAVALLRHVAGAAADAGGADEVRQRAVLQLAALLLPSARDPRVAVEAAKALAHVCKGDEVLGGLASALPRLEALAKGGSEDAPAAGGKGKGKSKGKGGKGEEPQEGAGGEGKMDRKAVAAAVERAIVAALSKPVASDPAGTLPKVLQLVQGSTAAAAEEEGGEGGGAGAAAVRTQHVLLLAVNAAAAAAPASKGAAPAGTPAKGGSKAAAGGSHSDSGAALHRAAVQLAELLLPYVRLSSDEQDWAADYATYVESAAASPGLPTPAHAAAAQRDLRAAHSVVVLGSLLANLSALPDADGAAASAEARAAVGRSLGALAAVGCAVARLGRLPQLVVAKALPHSARSPFLAGLYVGPAGGADGGASPVVQCLALHVQGQLVAEAASSSAAGRHHHPHAGAADVGGWLRTLLPALGSAEKSVRAAACECLAVLQGQLASGKASAGEQLSAESAAAFCAALLQHRKLLTRDPEAACVLTRGSLLGGAAAAAAAAPTPSKAKKGAKAAGDAKSGGAPASGLRLELSDAAAAELLSYLTHSLRALAVDAAGSRTAAAVLACLLPDADAPADGTTPPTTSEALFAAACAYLHALVGALSQQPASATSTHGHLLQQLVRVFTPHTVGAAAAGRRAADDGDVSMLAAAAELLPPPPSVHTSAEAAAALAAGRLAAVSRVTPELFAALVARGSVHAAEVFSVLLARQEGDPDEAVRAAARAALERIPLSADLVTPLLDLASGEASASQPDGSAAAAPPSKKSKKAGGAAAPAAAAAAPVTLAALRDAVMAVELLQWRAGISQQQLLVPACQGLLRRLQPVMGSIVGSLGAEADGGEEEEDEAAGAAAAAAAPGEEGAGSMSSLAGYACTLALQALTGLAKPPPADAMESDEAGEAAAEPVDPRVFDLDLAVAMAREAPDGAVRNAALGLLAALAARMPEAALSHVLQVLSVVNAAAALQDDEYSRNVAAAALASVVPAWVAAGRGSKALWEQVSGALPALPPQRRLPLLLALLRALPQANEGLPEGLLVLLHHAAHPPAAAPAPAPTTPAAAKTPAKSKPSSKKARAVEQAVAEGADAVARGEPVGPPPAEWLPELASQLALQVELPSRLDCCARMLELALAGSGRQPHTALPRMVAAFVTAQLKLKVALTAASAQLRRPDADPALDASCRRLMEAALAQMQLLQPDALATSATPAAASAASLHKAVLASSRGLYALFGALQGVMAADQYLHALLSLVRHPSDKVKRRAIKLFTDKVGGVRAEIEDLIELPQRVRDAKLRQAGEAAAAACALLQPLLRREDDQPAAAPAAAGKSKPKGGKGAAAPAAPAAAAAAAASCSPITRQMALVALAAIAGEFGALQPDALLACMPAVLAASRDPHAAVRASALATVAALVRALGSRLVPLLPLTVSAAVAAADAAWARLAKAGSAAGGAGEASADAAEAEEEGEDEDDEEEGEGGGKARVRATQEEEAALELSSALACLHALVEGLGGFLSPHLGAVLAILLNPRVLACTVAGCDRFAASIRARLPAAIAPRLLLPALYERLGPCIAAADDAQGAAAAVAPTVALLEMVGAAAAAMEPKVAVQFHEHMFAFLLRALDVRQRRPACLAAHGEGAIDLVEAAAVRALVALVMKLSEAKFKPLFLRLLEWASTVTVPESGSTEPGFLGRMAALFAAVNALLDRLRSVLVPYFRYLLDLCIQHLGGGEEGGKKGRSKKKARKVEALEAASDAAGGGDDAAQQRLAWLLRLRVVRALHRCFIHDSVGFVDQDKFARLQPALVAQLDAEPPPAALAFLASPAHADRDLSSYITLGPTTAAFTAPDGARSCGPLGAASVGALLAMAVAANSDALWKPLNHAALMLTRSASPRTRALALELVAQLVDRLREEYLILLPETLPFISELLEDVDGAVAGRVREVVAMLEEISGEKLDEYLKV